MSDLTNTCPFDLTTEDSRVTTYPIKHPDIWDYYERLRSTFWVPNEIDKSRDRADYNRLTVPEQRLVDYILGFFAAADGIVNINLIERFKKDVPIAEAQYFYNAQAAQEDIHADTYGQLLNEIVQDEQKRLKLINSAREIPAIKDITDYIYRCIESESAFAERVIRMACVEGIFFTGCFCVIYWLQNRGFMPGLGKANEFIARDENMHTTFALLIYSKIKSSHKLSTEHVYRIVSEAVEISKKFTCEAMPDGLPMMNSKLMSDYIQSQADNLLALIGLPPLYGTKHGFEFMTQINLPRRSNFFEQRPTEYAKSNKPRVTGLVLDDF